MAKELRNGCVDTLGQRRKETTQPLLGALRGSWFIRAAIVPNMPIKAPITQRTTNPVNDIGILHPVRAPIAPLPAAKRSHCYDTVYDTAMRDEPRLEPTMYLAN